MKILRKIARSWGTTANTLRYVVEWERIAEAFGTIKTVGTLLDAGAGSGEYSRRLLSKGICKNLVAIEPFKENFEILKSNLSDYQDEVQFVNSTLNDIQVSNDSVDCIMCTQVLEHIEDHERVVDEFARVLRPGGHAVITVPRPPEPYPQGEHVREGYTEDDLKALFVPRGFEPIYWDWFLTDSSISSFRKVISLPFKGVYWPVRVLAGELRLTKEQRESDQPYGLLCVFVKKG